MKPPVVAMPTPGGAIAVELGVHRLFDAFVEHEQISLWYEPRSGYRGIIAIHNTVLGPAIGGTRFWPYATDFDALEDVLRLARGMTYKAALAGINFGGGKSVIIGDSRMHEGREAILRAHGRHVESLGGRYVTAEDVGTSPGDMETIRMETDHVVGLVDRTGDPSPVTAFGTYQGIRACAQHRWGSPDLRGKRVAVQGVGNVGYHLCKLLAADGASLVVTDTRADSLARVLDDFGAEAVAPAAIYEQSADIFAPCALGGVINDDTIPKLAVEIVAGAANNQLQEAHHGDELAARGVLYAPDYVLNAGGMLMGNAELEGWEPDTARRRTATIFDTTLAVLRISTDEGIAPHRAADRLAEDRIEAVAALRRFRP